MPTINKVCVGESLVGEGNEVAHIDLIMGPRGSAAETAFCNALTNNKDGFTTLLAVVAPNLPGNLQALGLWGRIMVIGISAGAKADLNLGLAMQKRARILGMEPVA